MNRTLRLSLMGIVFVSVPFSTQAAWWNSWFPEKETQIIYVHSTTTAECTPEVITKTVTDSSQNALIKSLQSQVASLKSQLTQKAPQTIYVMQATSTPVTASSTEISTINKYLARLDILDLDIDRLATSTLVDVINEFKMLPGARPILDDKLFVDHLNQTYRIETMPLRKSLHVTVDAYQRELKLRLLNDQ